MSSARNSLANDPFAALGDSGIDSREDPAHNVVQVLLGPRNNDTRQRILDALHSLSATRPHAALPRLILDVLQAADLEPDSATDAEFLDALRQSLLADF